MKTHFSVLSGGSGTRLWPLSRKAYPKQFYALGPSENPLLIESIERLENLGAEVSVITTQNLQNSTMGLVSRYKKKVEYIWEPVPRNTAPAIALLTYKLLQRSGEIVAGVFPADHVVEKQKTFEEAVQAASAEAAKGKIVCLGIKPTFPSDAYGYLELSEKVSRNELKAQSVEQFIEKPSIYKAERLLKTERVVWNAGIFIFKVETMAEAFGKHMPELWAAVSEIDLNSQESIESIYPNLEKESIDFGIMEKLDEISCIPADLGWSDLGSWEEVAKHQSVDSVIRIQSSESKYINKTNFDKQVAFIGVPDTIVVDTVDSLLVMQQGMGQNVREVVKQLETTRPELVTQHLFEERPWGRFEILFESEYCKSKRICVWPGQKLSYQSHKHRQEQWTIVKGEAELTLDDEVTKLKVGQSVFIPQGAKHRIANLTTEDMEFIEVQTGTYFGEDDITRYSDEYGRT